MAKNEKRVKVTLGLRRLQAAQLHHHEEQAERPRAHRDARSTAAGTASTRSTRRPARPRGYCRRNPCLLSESYPVMSPDLAGLVTAARSGDRSAFDELVQATYADMYTLAYRLTGNEEDARDVVQDAYLRAYRGLKRFRGDARFTTWMYRITANCASTTWPSGPGTRHEDLDEDSTWSTSAPTTIPSCRPSCGFERDRVARALAELPAPPAGRHRPPGRLRPAPRVHRRRARHHRGGGQGPAAPGPAQAAGAAVPPPRRAAPERGRDAHAV